MLKAAEPWSLTSLREKLIKIGAKVVGHGRYLTFQMAEVAVSRQMLQEILMLIARLRAHPHQHDAARGSKGTDHQGRGPPWRRQSNDKRVPTPSDQPLGASGRPTKTNSELQIKFELAQPRS
jgi:hypothetical protein